MNLILFEAPFETMTLSGADDRSRHIRKVLRAKAGTLLFVGFINGERARAEVCQLFPDGSLQLRVIAREPSPPQLPVSLLIGLPRPHTAKRLLFEAASLGVRGLHFFEAARSEPAYAESSLWRSEAWRERLRLGAEQSFSTSLPEVCMHADLQSAISTLFGADLNIVLDNYEGSQALNHCFDKKVKTMVLALGPEPGWSSDERDVFRKNGWKLAHMGPHVLRSETAAVAAIAASASALGLWRGPTKTALAQARLAGS